MCFVVCRVPADSRLHTLQSVTAATTFALLEELIHRDGLPIALANRHDLSLEPILRFLVKHITNPRYCVLAADVATVLIGSSHCSSRAAFDDLLTRLLLQQRSTPPPSASHP